VTEPAASLVFGVTTVATQVEGGADSLGKAPSIWDVFAALPGRIADGSTPDVAADQIHRWPDDVALLGELGVDAYRFSLSWSRVQPDGTGPANASGLGHYDRLVDALLAAGIEPRAALHHWDMPLALMEQGGWLLRDTAERFADYTLLAVRALGDRVSNWSTVDEPALHTALGYAVGIDAPGLTLLGGAFQAAHHQLLAHARAVSVLRAETRCDVGIVNSHTLVLAASDSSADAAAARFYDAYHNGQFAAPVLAGRYPGLVRRMPGAAEHVVLGGDLAAISAPLDWYGLAWSHPTVIAAAPENPRVPFSLETLPDAPLSDAEASVHPGSLTALLGTLRDRYPAIPPIYVLDNGFARRDGPADAGSPEADTERARYISDHVRAAADAAASGVDVGGYFYRPLVDGWEWANGFTQQYGLAALSPERNRVPRHSFDAYRELMARHRLG
jgi:beta-glucosidase